MSKAPGVDHHGTGLPTDVGRRLREELASLRVERDQLRGDSADDHRAADAGDRAEAMRLADDVFRIEDRITEISRLLTVGTSSQNASANGTALTEGTRVTVRFADGDEETFYASSVLTSVPDGSDAELLGLGSPLAKAIAGRTVGDTITWMTPGGPQKADLVHIA